MLSGGKIQQFWGTAVTGAAGDAGFSEKDLVDIGSLPAKVGKLIQGVVSRHQLPGEEVALFSQGQPFFVMILACIDFAAKGLDSWFLHFA